MYKGKEISGAGDAVMFMQSTTGMVLFLVCPVLILIIWDFIYRRKADKREQEQRKALEEELETLRKAKEEKE